MALPPGRLLVPGPLGTVDTVAGPGFCTGSGRPDPQSAGVGALAADAGGTLWFESGTVGEGVLTKVSNTGALLLRTGVASFAQRDEAAAGRPSEGIPPASLLAASRHGGVLAAVPTAVLEYADDFVTVAGTAPLGSSKTVPEQAIDGPLRTARFNGISAIATDLDGNVYVADAITGTGATSAIRFVNRSDQPVTFYAGSPHQRSVAAGAVATIAGADGIPTGPILGDAPVLAVAGDRLYLATGGAPRSRATVRVLNLGPVELSMHGVTVSPGAMAEVVSANVATPESPGAPSASAPMWTGIATDEQGNLFLAEPMNHRVRKLNATGSVVTFAGTGAPGFNGNDGPATEARLDRPYDVEVGAGGSIYISDAGNAQVRVVDQAGTIRAAAGNGTSNRWLCADGDSPPAPGAEAGGPPSRTGSPASLASDPAGNLYLASPTLDQVHRLAPSASLLSVAGRPPSACAELDGCPVGDDAPPSDADLARVRAVASGLGGGIYVTEETRVRFLNLGSDRVTVHGVAIPPGAMRTVVGKPPELSEVLPRPVALPTVPPIATGPPGTTPDGERAAGVPTGVSYNDVAADSAGNLMLAEIPQGPLITGNGSVREVDSRGVITTLIDRPGRRPDGTVDPTRCCADPAGLTTDAGGNVYIADTSGQRVWFLNRSSVLVVAHGVAVPPGRLEVVAGAGETGSQDERIRALDARLSRPRGLAVDGAGNLYVADSSEHSVHRVDSNGIITTVAGNGQPGFNGDGLKGQLTALNEPTDVIIDGCGNLLVTDSRNDRVRRLNLVGSCRAAGPAATASGTRRPLYASAAVVVALAVSATVVLSRRRRHQDASTPADVAALHGEWGDDAN